MTKNPRCIYCGQMMHFELGDDECFLVEPCTCQQALASLAPAGEGVGFPAMRGAHAGCNYLAHPGQLCDKCGKKVPDDVQSLSAKLAEAEVELMHSRRWNAENKAEIKAQSDRYENATARAEAAEARVSKAEERLHNVTVKLIDAEERLKSTPASEAGLLGAREALKRLLVEARHLDNQYCLTNGLASSSTYVPNATIEESEKILLAALSTPAPQRDEVREAVKRLRREVDEVVAIQGKGVISYIEDATRALEQALSAANGGKK